MIAIKRIFNVHLKKKRRLNMLCLIRWTSYHQITECTSCYKLLNITPGIGWHPQNRILYCYKSRPLSTWSGQNVWFFCWEDVTECGRKFTKNGTRLCRCYTGYLFFALYNIKSSIVKMAIHCKHKSKTMNLILMINITKEC